MDRDRGAHGAAQVSAGIFLSRISGLVRKSVVAYFFGNSLFTDAWTAALKVPNVLQNLLGEGTLSASFIPVYAEFLHEGKEEEAGRFAGAALGILALVAGGMALLGVLLAPLLVRLLLAGFDPQTRALTVTLVRILFPMTAILVISAWCLGILNTHRRFFVSYMAPVLWNLAIIATLVAAGLWFGLGQRDLIVAMGFGALAGGVLQVAIQLPFLPSLLEGFRLSRDPNVAGVREAIRNFVPVVTARGVVNLSGLLDAFLASFLAEGALAIMGFAQTLYLLPISLFGLAVAAAELPEMSRQRKDAKQVLAQRIRTALERVAYFVIPSALTYLFLGDVIVGGLFERGVFGEADTLVTWGVLSAYSLGVLASASSRALSSGFYALRDTRTPARIAYLRVALSVMLGAALMVPLDGFGVGSKRLGAAGLALAASAGAWMEYGLLRRSLSRVVGAHGPDTGKLWRMGLAASLAVAVGVGLQLLLPQVPPLLLALETLVPSGVVYLAATHLLGVGMRLRLS